MGRLDAVRAEAATRTACPLHRDATQTVFGEGPVSARTVLVGEQPGDREDRAGVLRAARAARVSASGSETVVTLESEPRAGDVTCPSRCAGTPSSKE